MVVVQKVVFARFYMHQRPVPQSGGKGDFRRGVRPMLQVVGEQSTIVLRIDRMVVVDEISASYRDGGGSVRPSLGKRGTDVPPGTIDRRPLGAGRLSLNRR